MTCSTRATVPVAAALAAPAMLRLRGAPLALYLALATVTSVWVATNWRYEQPDWRSALVHVEAIDSGAPVVALGSEPVVRTYLDRQPVSAGGLVVRRAWIVVAPVRAAHQRAFGPAPSPGLPGFTTVRSLQVHAFALTLVGAQQATRITAGSIPGSFLFPARSS
jgi:hypothetical protein